MKTCVSLCPPPLIHNLTPPSLSQRHRLQRRRRRLRHPLPPFVSVLSLQFPTSPHLPSSADRSCMADCLCDWHRRRLIVGGLRPTLQPRTRPGHAHRRARRARADTSRADARARHARGRQVSRHRAPALSPASIDGRKRYDDDVPGFPEALPLRYGLERILSSRNTMRARLLIAASRPPPPSSSLPRWPPLSAAACAAPSPARAAGTRPLHEFNPGVSALRENKKKVRERGLT